MDNNSYWLSGILDLRDISFRLVVYFSFMNKRALSQGNCREKRKKQKCTNAFCCEIWLNVFQYLDMDEFQNIRLISKDTFLLPWKNLLKNMEFHFPTRDESLKIYDMSYVSKLKVDFETVNESFFNNEKFLNILKDVKEINLFLIPITDSSLEYLLKTSCQIEKLSLSSCHKVTNQGMEFCKKLKELDLSGTNITDEGLKFLSNLEKLDLSMCKITDQGLSHLKETKSLNLTSCNQITDKGIQHLEKIEELVLDGNKHITDKGLSKLIKLKSLVIHFCPKVSCKLLFPYLRDLEELDLEGIKELDQGIEYLTKLKKLKVNRSDIEDKSFAYLKNVIDLSISNCKRLEGNGFNHLKSIVSIDLSNNSFIQDSHLKFFQDAKHINLQDCTEISDQGLAGLKKVRSLNLRNCIKITDEGLKNLSDIVSLNIKGCKEIKGHGFRYFSSKLRELIIGDGNNGSSFVSDQTIEYIGKYLTRSLERIKLLECEKITSGSLSHLSGIRYFEMSNCPKIDYFGLSLLKGAKEFDLFAVGVSGKDLERLKTTIGLKRWRGII